MWRVSICSVLYRDVAYFLTLQEALDEATEHWGIMVERVEMYVKLITDYSLLIK